MTLPVAISAGKLVEVEVCVEKSDSVALLLPKFSPGNLNPRALNKSERLISSTLHLAPNEVLASKSPVDGFL